MTADTWMIISIVGFVGAGLALAAVIILFFRLNIIGVYGIVSGKTASKEIEKVWARERMRAGDVGELDFFRRKQSAEAVSGGQRELQLKVRSEAMGLPRHAEMGEAKPSDALSAMQINRSVGPQIGASPDSLPEHSTEPDTGSTDYHEDELETSSLAIHEDDFETSMPTSQDDDLETTMLRKTVALSEAGSRIVRKELYLNTDTIIE